MIITHFDEPRSRMIRGLTLKLFEHCLEVGFHGPTGRRVVRIVVVVHGGLDVIVLARVLSPVGPHRLCGLPYGLLCGVLCGLLCGPGRGCAGTCRVTATFRVTACNTHHQSTFCRLDIAFGTSFGRSSWQVDRTERAPRVFICPLSIAASTVKLFTFLAPEAARSVFLIQTFWLLLYSYRELYRGEWKIIIGSKGLFCDLESTRRVCLCTLYPKPNPSKAISCVLSPKMNSPAHQTCDFMVKFGAENGHFWHISLLWHVAQIRGSMLKKIAQIRAFHVNRARYWSFERPVACVWVPIRLEQRAVTSPVTSPQKRKPEFETVSD